MGDKVDSEEETSRVHLLESRDDNHYVELGETVGKQQSRGTPWFVWPVFVTSVLVGSSSSSILKSMEPVAPVSLSGWRHQLSSLVMLPGFVLQWSRFPKGDRQRALLPTNLGLHFLCALSFAAHFATYFWSLGHTSMTHSLFLTCMSPIFVALHTKLRGGVLLTGEVVGVSLGLVGATILCAGTRVEKDNESTHVGDLVALSSAAVFTVYLTLGRSLRRWMPLFVFQFPIALVAAILLGVTGVLLEGWNESKAGEKGGPFGWTRPEYLLGTILLAVGPGFVGHAGYSVVLRYSSPLVLPTGLSVQPLLGSVLGWALGYSSTPGLWTCLGGMVTLSGTLVVSYAAESHKANPGNTHHGHHPEQEYQQPAADGGGKLTKPLLQPSELP